MTHNLKFAPAVLILLSAIACAQPAFAKNESKVNLSALKAACSRNSTCKAGTNGDDYGGCTSTGCFSCDTKTSKCVSFPFVQAGIKPKNAVVGTGSRNLGQNLGATSKPTQALSSAKGGKLQQSLK